MDTLITHPDLKNQSTKNEKILIGEWCKKSFGENVSKIVVITGKGLRSQSKDNPYVSEKLSILRYSVPEFIKSRAKSSFVAVSDDKLSGL